MSSLNTFNNIFLVFAFVLLNNLDPQYAFEENNEINVFREVNENLKNCIDELFILLQPTKKFLTNTKIKLFQSMHENLELISESYYNKYKELLNDVINDTYNGSSLLDLNELFEDVINDYESNIGDSNKTIKKESFLESLIAKEYPESTKNSKSKVKMKEVLEVWEPENATDPTRRIFEGQSIKISNYPFVASIHHGQQFLCGGSIIWSDLILSAASCLQIAWNNRLYKTGYIPLTVRVGSSFTYMLGEPISVLHLYFHPKYDPKTLQHNLVIVRLSKQLSLSGNSSGIRRIELDRSVRLSVNIAVVILGWGETRHSDDLKPSYQKLSMATMPIYDWRSCEDIYSDLFVRRDNFCAGYITVGGGACYRDVGDPGVMGSILMGVVSFGPPVCGTPNSPTVLTMVSHYADWIDGIMKLPARKPRRQTTRTPVKKVTTKPPTTTTRSRQVLRTTRKNVEDILKNVLVELFETTYYDREIEKHNDYFLNGDDE